MNQDGMERLSAGTGRDGMERILNKSVVGQSMTVAGLQLWAFGVCASDRLPPIAPVAFPSVPESYT